MGHHNGDSDGEASDVPGYKTWQRVKIFSVVAILLAIIVDYFVR